MHSILKARSIWPLLCICLSGIWSCNDRPVVSLDQALNSSSAQQITIGAKTKIDMLFVIDESQSMEQEQISLGMNFGTFSDFIFQDLNNAVDYRIAVASTGSRARDANGAPVSIAPFPDQLGRFVSSSSDVNCPDLYPVISPATVEAGGGCQAEDLNCLQAQLGAQFSCLARVGIEGINNERGLESMRSALSCNGPNGHLFGRCCQADSQTGRLNFDPLCRGGGEDPEFLRPDAFLMVVFITDEDDCSTYASSGIDSPFATCRADPQQMYETLNGTMEGREAASNLIFTAYTSSPDICGGDPTACYNAECTDASGSLVDPVDCYYTRCELKLPDPQVDRAGFGSACRWQANKLAPVDYYFNFLTQLKSRPTEQLLVANIVSPGLLTSGGARLSFSEQPSANIDACAASDVMRPTPRNIDMCCPNGQCNAISDFNSCRGGNNNELGYSAWRYIDLMTMFGDNGFGCREGQTEGCVDLCTPDLSLALGELRAKVIDAVGDYCVARRPACLITDPMTGSKRPCSRECTDPATGAVRTCPEGELSFEELEAENYALRLKQTCQIAPPEGSCGVVGAESYLQLNNNYTLEVNDPSCASGMRVKLSSPPPSGSITEMELLQSLVEFDE